MGCVVGWKLTDTEIRKTKAIGKVVKLYDSDGLFLVVRPSGSKSFYLRYSMNGKRRDALLGKYPNLSLRQARLKAAEYHAMVEGGEDPRLANKREQQSGVFNDVYLDWLAKCKNNLSEKDQRLIRQRLGDFVLPKIGVMAMSDIRTVHIKDVIDDVVAQGKVETAKRCLSYVSQIFRYAVLCELCEFDVTAPLKGYIKPPPVKNMACITDPDAFGELLRKMWGYQGRARVRAGLRLSAYCLVRPGELRHAEWSEIDWDNRLWCIPADKMKMGRDHIVPMSDQIFDLFSELKEFTGRWRYVFGDGSKTDDKPMSENTINKALHSLGYKGVQTAHGFRGTASTFLHELGYNELHIEAQLAHVETNKVKGAYNHAVYLEQRRKMMQDYSDYLDKLRC